MARPPAPAEPATGRCTRNDGQAVAWRYGGEPAAGEPGWWGEVCHTHAAAPGHVEYNPGHSFGCDPAQEAELEARG